MRTALIETARTLHTGGVDTARTKSLAEQLASAEQLAG
jgi:hypothetical protein